MTRPRMVPRFRNPPRRSPEHLAYLRRLPCCTCPREPCGEASHTRYRDHARGKDFGIGQRADDFDAVPQCAHCHRPNGDGTALHDTGKEREWWERRGLNPYDLAAELESVSGDLVAGAAIVRRYRKGAP